jgi:hypothetical protein
VSTHLESLRANLEGYFQLPPSAVEWLLMLFNSIQVFDDVADGDIVCRGELDKCIWDTLVAMPMNQFFCVNASTLLPVVAVNYLKWQASDRAERSGDADAKSFVWRAGFYDICMIVVQLCHGIEKAIQLSSDVMRLYGENFEDYRKEFVCQTQ